MIPDDWAILAGLAFLALIVAIGFAAWELIFG